MIIIIIILTVSKDARADGTRDESLRESAWEATLTVAFVEKP